MIHRSKMARSYDYLFKFFIIGDTGVGKRSLMTRFVDDVFSETLLPLTDFKIHVVDVDGQRVKLQIWDATQQERFRTSSSTYYRSAHGIIFVYDVCNSKSFQNISRRLKEFESFSDIDAKILVGNKNDNLSSKIVPTKDAQELADLLEMPFFETSAKENIKVDDMFMEIIRMALRSEKNRKENNSAIRIIENPHSNTQNKSCF